MSCHAPGRRAQVGARWAPGGRGDALLQEAGRASLGLLLAGCPLDRQAQPGARIRGLVGAAPHHRLADPREAPTYRGGGPVAGSPSVMLGRDGEGVEGQAEPTEGPLAPPGLCARLVCGQSTRASRRLHGWPVALRLGHREATRETLQGRLRSPGQGARVNKDSSRQTRHRKAINGFTTVPLPFALVQSHTTP